MRTVLSTLLLLAALHMWAKQPITFIDANDSTPVAGASVLSNTGMIIGTTDSQGTIEADATNDFPLIIRSLGYEPATISQYVDTARLKPTTYSLSEVVVSPANRPITKVVCYAREYCSATTSRDTMQMYCDYMMVAYFANGKVKGYKKYDSRPSARNARRYARFADSSGLDSVTVPKHNDDITSLSFISNFAYVPFDTITEQEAIRNGASTDTVQGKFYPSRIYRKSNGLYSVVDDGLCNHKEHKWSPLIFKLIGLTMELQQMQVSWAYNANPEGKYGIYDFIYSTSSFHSLCKGKFLKKAFKDNKEDIELDCYTELYPVDIEYLTVDEYKASEKEMARIPFKEPKNLQPLAPTIRRLIDRIDNPQAIL